MRRSDYDHVRDQREDEDAADDRAKENLRQRTIKIAETYPETPLEFADKSKLTAQQIHALDNEWAQDEYAKFIDAISSHEAHGRISKMESAA